MLVSLYLLFLFTLNFGASLQGYWWTVGNTNIQNISPHTLMTLHKFSRPQRMLVENAPKLLQVIGKGAAMAIQECQNQFQDRKWNCSNYSSESVFGKVLNKACRETAFIHAITSAGVTFSLTENCARGFIKRCHCESERLKRSRRNSNNWIFEGCRDTIRYGYQKGKLFVDAKETSRDFKSVVNLHNNEAGRLAVVDSMEMKCKCHGVSGNCNVQTCRKTLPVFSEIGKKLKDYYNVASKVVPVQIKGNRRITRNHLGSTNEINIRPTDKDLVYFEDSPDFCTQNLSDGSLGTQGRYCNASLKAQGVDGCELLCCGRSWKTENLTREENCNCTFKWCCEVQCERCRVTKEHSYCK